jgi:NAD(P)-dependent dehydrogenase (short-subunit alcohol dehydrogenase family)
VPLFPGVFAIFGHGNVTCLEGSICNIGSMSAHTGQPFINAYCASKGALETLTRTTAFSVTKNRIRVSQVNVGWMSMSRCAGDARPPSEALTLPPRVPYRQQPRQPPVGTKEPPA